MAAASPLALSYVVFTNASAQQAGDVVADEQVTERDIEQRSKFDQLATHKLPSRQQVIDELRNERKTIRDARKAGFNVPDIAVDDEYAAIAARMHMTAEQLKAQLVSAGVDPGTFEQRIRADLAARRTFSVRPSRPAPSPGWRE